MLTMLVAVAVFALMDAGLKPLSAHYPPFQVAALRGASSLPLVLAWALATAGLRPLLRVRWPLHLLRGVLGMAMMASFVYALRTLPLSTAYSIFFIAPLLITALSVPFLGERVGPRRWIAIAVGLLGVVVLLRPERRRHAEPGRARGAAGGADVRGQRDHRAACWRAPTAPRRWWCG